MKIAINTCFGGFSLSDKVKKGSRKKLDDEY